MEEHDQGYFLSDFFAHPQMSRLDCIFFVILYFQGTIFIEPSYTQPDSEKPEVFLQADMATWLNEHHSLAVKRMCK